MSVFSCVMSEVQDVVRQVTSQAQQVEDVVGNIRGGMGPIQGGGWIGEGADAFMEEVNNRLIPEIMALIASIMGFGGGVTSAMNMVEQADNDVFGVVSNVTDTFDSIF